jgi:RES domain-containing protein
MPTLYLAEDPETAFAEANQINAAVRMIDPSAVGPAPPTVILSAVVHLLSLLDVTSPDVQRAIGATDEEILSPWRAIQKPADLPLTQMLGQAVFDAQRFHGIRYRSARLPDHRCLAIFTERLVSPAFIEVYDPHDNVTQRIP